MLDELRQQVCEANRALVRHGLVTLTWGNVSGFDTERGVMAIKPSGVAYDQLTPDQIVLVNLDGDTVEGDLRPSSDTPTHLELYRRFPDLGGVTHTHSFYATMYAQARQPVPCFGTTHADHFAGPVPVTRPLTPDEVESDYELNTGRVIIERFTEDDTLRPATTPAVLVAGHAPFCWGPSPAKSVDNAIALEAVARMALGTTQLNAAAPPLESYVLQKHHRRKHGPDAYYGQPTA
jgi:L-ribulose-5-phosphate 4-epimerase